MFPERGSCATSSTMPQLWAGQDFYSSTHHPQATQDKQKKYTAIKNWSVLSSCPLQNVFKKAKPSA